MKHLVRLPLLLAAALALAAPAAASQNADPVAFFNAAAMEFPESIAIDKSGNCYLSMVATGVIKKVTPAGVQSVFAKITDSYILGLKFDAAGENLYVAAGAGVWKVTPAGVISLYSSIPGDALNDLAFDPLGNLYVSYQTDDKVGAIWKVDPKGVAKAWSTSPLLFPKKSFMPFAVAANGLAVDPTNKLLYVSVTSAGRIVEIKINPDGTAGAARMIVENDALIGADGIILDDRGNLLVSVNLQNRISKVTPDGRVLDIAAGGLLSFPTSVALDTRNGRTALYVCNNGNFFFGDTQANQGLLRIFNPDASRLLQVSTRAQVGTGNDLVVAGFVIDGTASKTVLLRAVGPTLAAFGVTGALADPKIELYSGNTKLSENDNWAGDPLVAAASAGSGAFALASTTSKDAALLVTLAPGTYTARVSGVAGTTGTALLEIYETP